MNRSQALTLAVLLLPVATVMAGEAGAGSERPGEHLVAVDALLDGIVVRVAPLITKRSGISIHDALRWLQFTSMEMDIAGRGLPLDVLVPDTRPRQDRMTMDAWYQYEGWQDAPHIACQRTGWQPPSGPRIEDVTARDYMEHVLAVAGWAYRVQGGKVVVFDPKGSDPTAPEPPAGADPAKGRPAQP
jgi:hypothetical protein